MSPPLLVTPSLVVRGELLSWTAVRASGPGGQNVNKVSSKVELRFDLPRCRALDDGARQRLLALASGRLDREGRLIVVSERTRDQHKNLEDARERLRALIAAALVVPRARRPTRPSRGAQQRRLSDKRRQGEKKRERGERA